MLNVTWVWAHADQDKYEHFGDVLYRAWLKQHICLVQAC